MLYFNLLIESGRQQDKIKHFNQTTLIHTSVVTSCVDWKGAKMSNRKKLPPFFRIFQWNGLSPVSLVAEKPKSFWRREAFLFSAITLMSLFINFSTGVHYLSRVFLNYQFKKGHSKLFAYTYMLVGVVTRINAVTVLTESYARRSMQTDLLTTFDEIETIFREKLNFESKKRQLQVRIFKFIIIAILKIVAMAAFVILGSSLSFQWQKLYISIVVVFIPFYTNNFFYAQWMMYVDMVRFNIEKVNEYLLKIGDEKHIDRLLTDGRITQLEASLIPTMDACERLTHLRKCYSKIWHASVLINRCFRWSFFINNSKDLYLLVTNLYWILFHVVKLNFFSRYNTAFCVAVAGMILMNFIIISLVCEDINVRVS